MRSQFAGQKRLVEDLEGFKSLISLEICEMRYQTDLTVTHPASLECVQAGPLDILRYTGDGVHWCNRSCEHIWTDRLDYYVVCLPISAHLSLGQNGINAVCHSGTFSIVSTRLPFDALIRPMGDEQAFSALHVRVPGSLLRLRIRNVDDICGHTIEIHRGSGHMMLSLIDIALNDGPDLSEDARDQFGAMLLDTIADAVLSVGETVAKDRDQASTHRRIRNRAEAYIAAHLSDPELGPQQVAQFCGISVRYLHRAFASLSPETVATFIRENRLQACRAALQSPVLRKRSITQIANDWGFNDSSHFCHVYRNRFGKTPREDKYRVSHELA